MLYVNQKFLKGAEWFQERDKWIFEDAQHGILSIFLILYSREWRKLFRFWSWSRNPDRGNELFIGLWLDHQPDWVFWLAVSGPCLPWSRWWLTYLGGSCWAPLYWHQLTQARYDTSGRRHHQDQTWKMSEKNEIFLQIKLYLKTYDIYQKDSTFDITFHNFIIAVDASKNNDLAESGSNDEMRIWPQVKLFLDLKYFTTFSPPPSKILISVSPGGVAKIFL